MGFLRGFGLQLWPSGLVTFPENPWNLDRKVRVAPLPRAPAIRTVWGKARTPRRETGMGVGQGWDGGSAALLGQKGPSWDPLQARPWGDRGQGDKHTRHHHTTSPEKQEDNINPSRRYVLCRWDPSSGKTKWRPDSSGREVGDRERHRKEKKNKTENISTQVAFNSVLRITAVLPRTDHRPRRLPPNPGRLAT